VGIENTYIIEQKLLFLQYKFILTMGQVILLLVVKKASLIKEQNTQASILIDDICLFLK
jgi:hypothetical protein